MSSPIRHGGAGGPASRPPESQPGATGPEHPPKYPERTPLRIVMVQPDPVVTDSLDSSPGLAGVSWKLWALLVLSFVFFAAVRFYVRHEEAGWTAALRPEPAATIETVTPEVAVRPEYLRLAWDPVEGAISYRLHVTRAVAPR